MAGEIQIGGTTFATESGGTVTVSNVDSATNRTNLGLGSIATQAADSVSISGGNITGGTIGSSVVFPPLGELYLYDDGGSPVTFALNSTDSFVIFIWAQNTSNLTIANEHATLVAGTLTEIDNYTNVISWSWSDPTLTINIGSGYSARLSQVFRVG
jgi:hypothetical protein